MMRVKPKSFLSRLMRPDVVILDVDTQRDFFEPNGARRLVNAEQVHRNLKRLMTWARLERLNVISTVRCYRRDRPVPDGGVPHCLEATRGQRKLRCTLLPSRIRFEADASLDLPPDVLDSHYQVIFEKRLVDPFSAVKADRLLSNLRYDHVLVFGVAAEDAVRSAVLGLLHRGKRVSVVRDAVGFFNPETGELALRQMEAKGAALISTDQAIPADIRRHRSGSDRRRRKPIRRPKLFRRRPSTTPWE